jgi:hypothetical protein
LFPWEQGAPLSVGYRQLQERFAMAETFDPAPPDKYADPSTHAKTNKKEDELDRALSDSFPASDPPSRTQPSKTRSDAG